MSNSGSQMAEDEQAYTKPFSNDGKLPSESDILEEMAGLHTRASEVEEQNAEDEVAMEDFSKSDAEISNTRILEHKATVESTTQEASVANTDKLRRSYDAVCKAVAEFELNASTLRSNSSAMTLSKKLVLQSAADIFIVLRDFRPRLRPDIPEQAGKRMANWARRKKGESERGDPWKAIEQQLGRLSTNDLQEDEKRERKRTRRLEEREKAFKAEETATPASRLRRERWGVPKQWWYVDDDYEIMRLQGGKKRADTNARLQLRELGVIDTGENSESKIGFSVDMLEDVHTDLWGDGWLKRTEAEYEWMVKDQIKHSDEWKEDWSGMRLWRNDVREWTERWRWRNDVVDVFEKTSADLLLELGKIDGSVSERELNVFKKTDDAEWHRQLINYTDNMKIALLVGDEGQFTLNCNSMLDLTGGVLRSKGVKQGLDTLIKRQNHFRNSFMDFATVAIFFSSITATTLQFSFQSGDSTIPSMIVNICWFASLVLSIASATNSLLGVLVHQSPEYLRPSQNLHFQFLQNWFKFIPPTLLTCSGVLFLVGFCAFSFLFTDSFSGQGRAVQSITMTFTATNFAVLSTIFLLAFTQVTKSVLSLVYHFTMVLICLLLHLPLILAAFLVAFAAAPFRMFYYWIRRKPLPQDWIWIWGGFAKADRALHNVFHLHEHWKEFFEAVDPLWQELKLSFASTFSGIRKKLDHLILRLSPTVPAPALDGPGHQSIRMGSVGSGTTSSIEPSSP